MKLIYEKERIILLDNNSNELEDTKVLDLKRGSYNNFYVLNNRRVMEKNIKILFMKPECNLAGYTSQEQYDTGLQIFSGQTGILYDVLSFLQIDNSIVVIMYQVKRVNSKVLGGYYGIVQGKASEYYSSIFTIISDYYSHTLNTINTIEDLYELTSEDEDSYMKVSKKLFRKMAEVILPEDITNSNDIDKLIHILNTYLGL